MRTTWRPIATVFILLITIAAFANYFASHPQVRQLLRDTSPILLLSLLGLYVLFVGSLALINSATLRLCGTRLIGRESLLLTMYSSVINFFGPLQSGPAFRALYLKKMHGTNLKSYGTATLVYYGFYAFFSGLFLVSGLLGWWLIPLAGAGLLILWLTYRSPFAFAERLRKLDLSGWYYLAAATFLQVSLLAIIYYVELRSVMPGIHFSQVIIYTGAANFALFVSLTPGAIGFRESFLVFSEKLHHVSNNAIVVANTIDRAVYISLLLFLAVAIFATHAQKKLAVATADAET
ncbi:MAG: hypothetical protein JWO35_727 [Candidatus Saccharibacteria bacterium]|nr:hypothetical protein [Candidatus Saccharibacteria bacterium]